MSATTINFGQLPALQLRAPDGAEATITLYGAHLVSWKAVTTAGGPAQERLFMSSLSALDGQKAIRGVMPSAEIFSMDGEDGVSALTAGGLSDDGGWVLRQEVALPWQLPGAVGVLPYGYWAAARPSTRLPGGTAQSHATSWGFGLRAGWRNASLAAEWGRASITPGSRRTSQAFFKAQVQF